VSTTSKASFDIPQEMFKVGRSGSCEFREEVRSTSLATTVGANQAHHEFLLFNALKEKRFGQVPDLRHALKRGPSDCHTWELAPIPHAQPDFGLFLAMSLGRQCRRSSRSKTSTTQTFEDAVG